MATSFFPALSYGEAGIEDIFQLCGDEYGNLGFPLPGTEMTGPEIDDASLFDELTPSTHDSSYMTSINPGAQTPDQLFVDGNVDLWTASIRHHSHPILDASIRVGMSDAFPSALVNYAAYPVLDTRLRNELVKVYFRNVHPLCPIIDEQNFWWHYYTLNEDEFLAMFPAILFNAMMFTAFAHATDEQVMLAGFSSTFDAQTCYVRALTDMYERACCEVESALEELVLAKTTLLLSMWCPPRLEVTVSSLWVDRAIHHTKQYLCKRSSNTDLPMPKRCNILYWCCIARNTCISFVMRRPYRLFIEDQPLCDPDDVRDEFEREILFHNFSSVQGKLRMVEDFVVLCKLSQNLNSILRSQRAALFELQWGLGQKTIEETDEDRSGSELHEYLSRYLEAAKCESALLKLIETHEENNCSRLRAMNTDVTSCEDPSEEMLAKMRLYTLTMMTYSSIATIYQFTLSTTSRFWARSCHRTALTKLKDASMRVALAVGHVLAEVSVEAIPGTILAWTVSPMIVFLVESTCGKYGLHQLSDDNQEDIEQKSQDSISSEAENLLALANLLAPRFQTAQDVVSLMRDLDHLLSCDAAVRSDHTRSLDSSAQSAAESRRLRGLSVECEEDSQAVDLDLLNQASRFMDTRVAFGLKSCVYT